MSSNSEKGHAKNVANFNLLVSYVKEIGPEYNPANAAITSAALAAKESASQTAMTEVTNGLVASKNAINARDFEFKGMSKMATRVINALKASGVNADILKDARGIVNKITGARTGPKPVPNPENPEEDPTSVSQMSFDFRKANFELLVALVKGQPQYNPNEPELKALALEAYVANLLTLNNTVHSTTAALNTKRNTRDEVLYAPVTGMSELVGSVKAYVKSLFGTSSPVYKRIAAIKITKPTNL
jgi:hypothetical protein